jgi:polyhydroxyalkanoate synthesis regulator phasin
VYGYPQPFYSCRDGERQPHLPLIPGDVYLVKDCVKTHVVNIGGAVLCIAVQPPFIAKTVKKVGAKGKLARKTPGVVNDGALMDFFSPVVAGRRARNVRTGFGRESVKGGENCKGVENDKGDENADPAVNTVEKKEVEKKEVDRIEEVLKTKEDVVEPISEIVEPTPITPTVEIPNNPTPVLSTNPITNDPTPHTQPTPIPSFQYKIIESAITANISAFRDDMMVEIQEMHVEMMRQFCLQREDMEGMLREYGVEPLVRELRELREENERLRRNF